MRLRPGTVALGHQKCKFFRDLISDSMWMLCMCMHVSEPEVRTRIKLYRDLSGRVKQNLYFPLICPPIPILPDLWSPGWEDHLKKEMATHSSILAWEIPWTEVGYSPWSYKRVGHDLETKQQIPILSPHICSV